MRSLLESMILVSGILVLMATQVMGYPLYDGNETDCKTCHTGFGGPGDTRHDLHWSFIESCLVCHASIGDIPETSKCAQCHVGPGLRLHHVNAPTAPDCTEACHMDDPSPFGEATAPPLYGTGSTTLTDPCSDNLDNDGDLQTDGEDPNCTGTAVEGFSWTAFKSLFE